MGEQLFVFLLKVQSIQVEKFNKYRVYWRQNLGYNPITGWAAHTGELFSIRPGWQLNALNLTCQKQ